jgi:hypothetical protein
MISAKHTIHNKQSSNCIVNIKHYIKDKAITNAYKRRLHQDTNCNLNQADQKSATRTLTTLIRLKPITKAANTGKQ